MTIFSRRNGKRGIRSGIGLKLGGLIAVAEMTGIGVT
jgi:hypothetical protein